LDCAHCGDPEEIALELVEVPVRCTVEIGRNGIAHFFASPIGDEPRSVVED
jgi:hypothetical protein